MNEEKLVSIVMPVYNAGKYLKENLESIKNQTYTNIEVLLVDDGSTDHSADVAQAFCLEDSRFNYFKQENQGAPAARNYGLRESKGDYLLFVDSDDVLKINAVELLYLTAQKQDADLVIGQYDTIDEEGKPLESKKMQYSKDGIYEVKDHCETLFFLSPLPGNKFYRASLIRENGLFFSDLKRAQDLNFYLKFLLFADKVCTLSDTTYLYRIRIGSISHTVSPVILETITSVNDVEAYYKAKDAYDTTLFDTLKLKYYSDQLAKIPQIQDKTVRNQTYNTLASELKSIKKETVLENYRASKLRVVRLKLMFPFLFKSDLYSSLQTLRLKRRMKAIRKSHE